jgi:integrase
MSIFKRGNVYWYKFMWNGEVIRESTRQGNDRKARNIESAHRTALANGLVGIREKKPAPVLADFLKKDFLPFVESKHTAKPATAEYYADGARMVCKCDFAALPLDRISDQHAQQFAAKYAGLSASRINCGLRSLRRALNLAYEWGKLERPAKVTLAKGERQRERVLTIAEWERYIAHCPQPWQDAALLIRGTGMRPGEVFALRWVNVHLNGNGGFIQITEGKTKAARRMLPMVPAVYEGLKARWEEAGRPEEGWMFPANSREGHLNKDTAKDQHKKALERANAKAKADEVKEIQPFPPYILRHTALTELANAGCDVFTLARIAGHSSITITQRYVHPQADAIERAFLQIQQAALPEPTPTSK